MRLGVFLVLCIGILVAWSGKAATGGADRSLLLAPTLTSTVDTPTPSPSPSATATTALDSPTPTATTAAPLESSTPTPTPTATATEALFSPTPSPTASPTLTSTQTLEPSPTPTIQPGPTPQAYHFVLQGGTPVWMQNFIHVDRQCTWMGVAGQVFGKDGKPSENLIVEVWGKMSGAQGFVRIALTGAGKGTGPGGYEITLADQLVPSDGSMRIQLLDGAGKALSAPYSFAAQADCAQNLVLVNFSYLGVANRSFLPLLMK